MEGEPQHLRGLEFRNSMNNLCTEISPGHAKQSRSFRQEIKNTDKQMQNPLIQDASQLYGPSQEIGGSRTYFYKISQDDVTPEVDIRGINQFNTSNTNFINGYEATNRQNNYQLETSYQSIVNKRVVTADCSNFQSENTENQPLEQTVIPEQSTYGINRIFVNKVNCNQNGVSNQTIVGYSTPSLFTNGCNNQSSTLQKNTFESGNFQASHTNPTLLHCTRYPSTSVAFVERNDRQGNQDFPPTLPSRTLQYQKLTKTYPWVSNPQNVLFQSSNEQLTQNSSQAFRSNFARPFPLDNIKISNCTVTDVRHPTIVVNRQKSHHDVCQFNRKEIIKSEPLFYAVPQQPSKFTNTQTRFPICGSESSANPNNQINTAGRNLIAQNSQAPSWQTTQTNLRLPLNVLEFNDNNCLTNNYCGGKPHVQQGLAYSQESLKPSLNTQTAFSILNDQIYSSHQRTILNNSLVQPSTKTDLPQTLQTTLIPADKLSAPRYPAYTDDCNRKRIENRSIFFPFQQPILQCNTLPASTPMGQNLAGVNTEGELPQSLLNSLGNLGNFSTTEATGQSEGGASSKKKLTTDDGNSGSLLGKTEQLKEKIVNAFAQNPNATNQPSQNADKGEVRFQSHPRIGSTAEGTNLNARRLQRSNTYDGTTFHVIKGKERTSSLNTAPTINRCKGESVNREGLMHRQGSVVTCSCIIPLPAPPVFCTVASTGENRLSMSFSDLSDPSHIPAHNNGRIVETAKSSPIPLVCNQTFSETHHAFRNIANAGEHQQESFTPHAHESPSSSVHGSTASNLRGTSIGATQGVEYASLDNARNGPYVSHLNAGVCIRTNPPLQQNVLQAPAQLHVILEATQRVSSQQGWQQQNSQTLSNKRITGIHGLAPVEDAIQRQDMQYIGQYPPVYAGQTCIRTESANEYLPEHNMTHVNDTQLPRNPQDNISYRRALPETSSVIPHHHQNIQGVSAEQCKEKCAIPPLTRNKTIQTPEYNVAHVTGFDSPRIHDHHEIFGKHHPHSYPPGITGFGNTAQCLGGTGVYDLCHSEQRYALQGTQSGDPLTLIQCSLSNQFHNQERPLETQAAFHAGSVNSLVLSTSQPFENTASVNVSRPVFIGDVSASPEGHLTVNSQLRKSYPGSPERSNSTNGIPRDYGIHKTGETSLYLNQSNMTRSLSSMPLEYSNSSSNASQDVRKCYTSPQVSDLVTNTKSFGGTWQMECSVPQQEFFTNSKMGHALPLTQPSHPVTHIQNPRIISHPVLIMPTSGSGSSFPAVVSDPRIKVPDKERYNSSIPNILEKLQQRPDNYFSTLIEVAKKVQEMEDDILKFNGKHGDQEYVYLEEMLMRQLLSLDQILAEGDAEVRSMRKSLVKEVQELIEILERRAKSS